MCSYEIFCNSWTFCVDARLPSPPVQSVSEPTALLSDSFVCVVNTESNTLYQPWRSLVFYSVRVRVCVCAQFVWGGPKVPPEADTWSWIFSMCFTDCGWERVAPGGVWVVPGSVRLSCAFRAEDNRHKLLTMLSLFSELCFSSSSSFFPHYFAVFFAF